jgi:DNA replication and repair protein RecF
VSLKAAPQLYLTRLAVRDFRNYAAAELALDGRPVCLTGPNGAGKTNLLEAISQLSPGRGLRSAGLSDLCRIGATGGWAVSARLASARDDAAVFETRLSVQGLSDEEGRARRVVEMDGAPIAAGEAGELFSLIWLTPAHDRVFAGGAGDRRRFLDRMVMAHTPSHGRAAAAYERAMRERNALLEQGGRADPVWLTALEGRMAEAGAAMIHNRARALDRLRDAMDTAPDGAFPAADLHLKTEGPDGEAPGWNGPAIEAALAADWASGRRRDAGAGRTLSGPHRTDLIVIHRPTGQPAALCSTGQQKALLIAITLANARALTEIEGEARPPLILLDEAAAHLDASRRAALFDALLTLPGQAWLTGTDANLFEAFGDRAQRFGVDAAKVSAL